MAPACTQIALSLVYQKMYDEGKCAYDYGFPVQKLGQTVYSA